VSNCERDPDSERGTPFTVQPADVYRLLETSPDHILTYVAIALEKGDIPREANR
jgi:hypothetical protein